MNLNNVIVNTATTGTGTVTLGSAFSGSFTTEQDKAVDGKPYSYVIREGSDFEEGSGIYTASGRTLTRNVKRSRIAGVLGVTPLTLLGTATVSFTPLAEYLPPAGVENGGRLTLTSGLADPSADVVGATAVYYTPAVHDRIGLYDGVSWRSWQFPEVTLGLDSNLAHVGCHAQNGNYLAFAFINAGAVAVGTGPLCQSSGVVTITIASPAVVTFPGTAPPDGTPVVLTTTGVLATGLTPNTTVFVKSPSGSTSNLAASVGGAAINTSGSQSGTHTATWGIDTATGTGAGTCEIEVFEGRHVNKVSMTVRNGSNTYTVAARQGRLLGGFSCTANGTTEDSYAKRFLSNVNAKRRPMKVVPATSSYNQSAGSLEQAFNVATNRLQWFCCLPGRPLRVEGQSGVQSQSATVGYFQVKLGLNSIDTSSADVVRIANTDNARQSVASAGLETVSDFGKNYCSLLQISIVAAGTWFGAGQSMISGDIQN